MRNQMSFDAVLHGDRLHWIDGEPDPNVRYHILVTLDPREEQPAEPSIDELVASIRCSIKVFKNPEWHPRQG